MHSTFSDYPKRQSLLTCFTILFLFAGISSCSKDKEKSYDPSGKCGFVISSQRTSSGAWQLTVDMEDGYIYKNAVSATPKNLGDRVCF